MKAKGIVAVVLSVGLLAGCASPYGYGYGAGYGGGYGGGGYGANYGGGYAPAYGNKATAGTLLGGVVGGLAGSRFGGGTGKLVAVGVGTLLGAALGNAAGQSMDRADLMYAQQAAGQAYMAPTGATVQWNNPQTGNWGTYTPTRDGTGPYGEPCREFQTSIVVGGQLQQGYGTACRQSDGSWRMVS
ncbi:membrane protein (plasmid) [Azospirillum argentinense]|nr:membrane protein [Azospirillum argentinense]EZQ05495.1 membrane protein [Azospirillum argentinense]KAA1055303.1 17 kDa surface antigen [Azospirillum argentinense]